MFMVKVPSRKQCLKLMAEYEMPEHIKAHSFKVRDISVFLAKELNKKGEKLDVKVVESSALLHDIAKMRCINLGIRKHDKEGAKILRSLGYDRIADIIEQHVHLWKKYKYIVEEEVVNYSDKRVLHDKIVPFAKRIKDVKERYSSIDDIAVIERETYVLERKIFKNLDFSPDELTKLLK